MHISILYIFNLILSTSNYISHKTFEQLFNTALENDTYLRYEPHKTVVRVADGSPIESLGVIYLDILVLERSLCLKTIILKSLTYDLIIGLRSMAEYGIIIDTKDKQVYFNQPLTTSQIKAKKNLQINPENPMDTLECIGYKTSALNSLSDKVATLQDDCRLQKSEPLPEIDTLDFNKSILDASQCKQVQDLLNSSRDIFGSLVPGGAKAATHSIDTGTHKPANCIPYRISPTERETIEIEVQKMLNTKVIQPSRSPWSSPVVLVKKGRYCTFLDRL